MSEKDQRLKFEIENILESESHGTDLIAYFENLEEKDVRRAISILSGIYPTSQEISDGELSFIEYMLLNKNITEQKSFPEFVRSINIVNYTDAQRARVRNILNENFSNFCEKTTFEFDDLFIRMHNSDSLINALQDLSEKKDKASLQHIFNILNYENFSDWKIPLENVERLKKKISNKLQTLPESIGVAAKGR